MAKINLRILIKIAPIEEKVKADLLAMADKLNDDQRYELSRILWDALADKQSLRTQQTINQILEEVKEGKRNYNINDFTEARAKLSFELSQDMDQAASEEDLEEVRKELKLDKEKKLGDTKISL